MKKFYDRQQEMNQLLDMTKDISDAIRQISSQAEGAWVRRVWCTG